MAGRLAEAEALYQQILGLDAHHAMALSLQAMLAQQRGDLAQALQFARRADAAGHGEFVYRQTLAHILKDLGQYDEAREAYEQVLAQNPALLECWFNLGRVYQELQNFAKAMDCYRRCLDINPQSVEALCDLGVAKMALEHWEEASACFTQALQWRPNDAVLLNNLGVTLKNRGDVEAAKAAFLRALDGNPQLSNALFNVGTLHFANQEWDMARTWYLRAIEAEPTHIESNQNLASIYLEAGELELAQQCRDRAYRRQSIFVENSVQTFKTVLVLWAAGKGNVPIEHLLPTAALSRITWFVEYASPEQYEKLPYYDFVFNAIGDVDVTGPTAKSVTDFLKVCTKPVLNRPEYVERTGRDMAALMFGTIADLVIPVTVRLPTENLRSQVMQQAGMRFPMLVRPGNSHGGVNLVKITSAEELAALSTFHSEYYYATNFHDFQSADGYYRKFRMVFVDGVPFPYHMAISAHWLVHYDTSDMHGHAWKLAEESCFLADPAAVLGQRAMQAIGAIGKALQLDFCGVDFALCPDGRVLLFEANATMMVHPEDPDGVLAHKNRYVARIFEAFNRLIAKVCADQGACR